jgi:imidazoleglycerol phosphate synthase glutamine amidotransferase subunit HisH
MRSIAVIDYGMGNLRSVVNALQVVTEGRDQVLLTSGARRSSRQPGSSRFSGFVWACRY